MSMRRQWWLALAWVPFAVGLAAAAWGGETKPKYKDIGVAKCAKMCHKSPAKGKQLVIWQGTDHAKAYKTLLTEEAKAVAKKIGLAEPPHESLKCLSCHATAAQWPDLHAPSFKIEDGVQCEACHGAGEKYKTMSVMKNPKKAAALGRVTGDETTCLRCHNDTSPTWKADRYTTKDGQKVGFDHEMMWAKIAHPIPKKD